MFAELRPKQDLLKRKGSLSSPNTKPCHVTEAADHVWIYKCDQSQLDVAWYKRLCFCQTKKESGFIFKKGIEQLQRGLSAI